MRITETSEGLLPLMSTNVRIQTTTGKRNSPSGKKNTKPNRQRSKPRKGKSPSNQVSRQAQTNRSERYRALVPSAHTYLNPWHTKGQVVKALPHSPYMVVESNHIWSLQVGAAEGYMVVLRWTGTNCKGFAGKYTAATGLVASPILAPQLATLNPTHIAMERLGLRATNCSPYLTIGGQFYALTTHSTPDFLFAADNLGDPLLRIDLVDTNALAAKILANPHTKVINNASILNTPLTRLQTVTQVGRDWSTYSYWDPADNGSNTMFEAALYHTDQIVDNTSCTILVWPIDGLVKTLSFQVLSQDGCRFDPSSAMYGSCTHARVVSNAEYAGLHNAAHRVDMAGHHDLVNHPVPAAPHESFMHRLGEFVSDVSTGQALRTYGPRVLRSLGGIARGGASLAARYLPRALPTIESIGVRALPMIA